MVIYKDKYIFYSVRTLICQQSPKLVLADSNKGLMLTASANSITKDSQTSCVLFYIHTLKNNRFFHDADKYQLTVSLCIH